MLNRLALPRAGAAYDKNNPVSFSFLNFQIEVNFYNDVGVSVVYKRSLCSRSCTNLLHLFGNLVQRHGTVFLFFSLTEFVFGNSVQQHGTRIQLN